MATQINLKELDLQEQLERIRRMSAESDKLHEEKLKLAAEQTKFAAEQLKLAKEAIIMPRNMIFQAMLAAAALLGAGAAVAKVIFP